MMTQLSLGLVGGLSWLEHLTISYQDLRMRRDTAASIPIYHHINKYTVCLTYGKMAFQSKQIHWELCGFRDLSDHPILLLA